MAKATSNNKAVLERDEYRCQYCGGNYQLEVHHIVYRSNFGKKRVADQELDSNKITLCKKHHEAAHEKRLIIVYLKSNLDRPRIVKPKMYEKILDLIEEEGILEEINDDD